MAEDFGYVPQVSIVMPALNSANTISMSIHSVMEQTFPMWELIVVDNQSEDSTCEIVREFMKKDKRICLIEEKSNLKSAAVARHQGILAARADWIAFLDSDDLWHKCKLERQMKFAQEHNESFLFTASRFLKDDKQLSFIFHAPRRISYPEILKQDVISCSSVLIKKKLLEGSFLEQDPMISEDYSAWIRILKNYSISAAGLDEPLLIYRLSRTSVSSNKFKSAIRTFRTYRHVGLSNFSSFRYWLSYAYRSLKKYKNIYLNDI